MRLLQNLTRRRGTRLLAASALLVGTGVGSTMLAAATAQATDCNTSTFTPATCTMTGTATLNGGVLGLEGTGVQAWTTTLNGQNQQIVDDTNDSFTVQDATGSGDGWTVTGLATQFAGGNTLSSAAGTTLAPGTLVFNGSATSETVGATPASACAPSTACTRRSPPLRPSR